MSLVYTLEMASSLHMRVVIERLCAIPEFQIGLEGVSAPGLLVDIAEPRDREIEVIEDEFDFTPRMSIMFRRGNDVDPVAVRKRLIRGCQAILEADSGDAVLLFNGEIVVLRRKDNRLVLNPITGFWTDDVLAVLYLHYEIESTASI